MLDRIVTLTICPSAIRPYRPERRYHGIYRRQYLYTVPAAGLYSGITPVSGKEMEPSICIIVSGCAPDSPVSEPQPSYGIPLEILVARVDLHLKCRFWLCQRIYMHRSLSFTILEILKPECPILRAFLVNRFY